MNAPTPLPIGITPAQLPTGQRPRHEKENATTYIATTATLPPDWTDDDRSSWECQRDDAILLLHRTPANPAERDRARRWLSRYNLTDTGQPHRVPAPRVP